MPFDVSFPIPPVHYTLSFSSYSGRDVGADCRDKHISGCWCPYRKNGVGRYNRTTLSRLLWCNRYGCKYVLSSSRCRYCESYCGQSVSVVRIVLLSTRFQPCCLSGLSGTMPTELWKGKDFWNIKKKVADNQCDYARFTVFCPTLKKVK